MDDESVPEAAAENHGGGADPLEPDPKLSLLAERAVAAGITGSWYRFKDPTTGKLEGPISLGIEIPSGRRVRRVSIRAEDAEALAQFKFERWTALGDYQAILDTDKRAIIAEVNLSGFPSFNKLPGVMKRSLSDGGPEPILRC